jgi:hypothetical protein
MLDHVDEIANAITAHCKTDPHFAARGGLIDSVAIDARFLFYRRENGSR